MNVSYMGTFIFLKSIMLSGMLLIENYLRNAGVIPVKILVVKEVFTGFISVKCVLTSFRFCKMI